MFIKLLTKHHNAILSLLGQLQLTKINKAKYFSF